MSELTNTAEKQVGDESLNREQTIKEKFRKNWQLYAKIIELVLCALCVGFVMEPAKRGQLARIHLDHFTLIFPTFIGYLIIISIFLVAKLLGDKIPYKTGFAFSLVACCLFFVAGILLAVDNKQKNFREDRLYVAMAYVLGLAGASSAASFFNSILFGVEAIYIWKFKDDFY